MKESDYQLELFYITYSIWSQYGKNCVWVQLVMSLNKCYRFAQITIFEDEMVSGKVAKQNLCAMWFLVCSFAASCYMLICYHECNVWV